MHLIIFQSTAKLFYFKEISVKAAILIWALSHWEIWAHLLRDIIWISAYSIKEHKNLLVFIKDNAACLIVLSW